MIPISGEDDWDFRPVFDLIHSLSIGGGDFAYQKKNSSDTDSDLPVQATFTASARVHDQGSTQLGDFDKIWQYLGQPLDLPPPTIPTGSFPDCIDVWDGQTASEPRTLKVVRWQDDTECENLADNDENTSIPDLSKLNKLQRKKERRKQRKEERATLTAQCTNKQAIPSGSEDEPVKDVQEERTLARSDVIYRILHGTPQPIGTGRLWSGKLFRNPDPEGAGALPVPASSSAKHVLQILKPVESALENAVAKKKKLISILHERFIDDRQYLSNLSFTQNLVNSTDAAAEGIHVFVDASNIMIGFHDALKVSRGQSIHQRIRRQPVSFHNLSLILERGRPTAKRIVVGSDNFPAMLEAKQIGYETNILDRVHKAKELTPRQKRYSNLNGNNGSGGGQSGTGSGSETTTAVQYAPEKWVEQAVDEILHLKMMESVVDADEPSTMVLATGDAAEAEYSGGFLKMVERALGKGWKIELASFSRNTSMSYKRNDFRQRWGERFKIVDLDDFVEVLLGNE